VELAKIGKRYKLNKELLQRLPNKFSSADWDETHSIDFSEFMRLLEMEDGVILRSLWKIYDRDKSRELDFIEFVEAMGKVASLRSQEDKLRWAFRLYDVNGNKALQLDEFHAFLADPNVQDSPDDSNQALVEQSKLKKILKKVCKDTNNVSEREFMAAVQKCPTLRFPAFVLIERVRRKVFDHS